MGHLSRPTLNEAHRMTSVQLNGVSYRRIDAVFGRLAALIATAGLKSQQIFDFAITGTAT